MKVGEGKRRRARAVEGKRRGNFEMAREGREERGGEMVGGGGRGGEKERRGEQGRRDEGSAWENIMLCGDSE